MAGRRANYRPPQPTQHPIPGRGRRRPERRAIAPSGSSAERDGTSEAAFAALVRAARADGLARLPPGPRRHGRRRGRVPGHVPGPGPQGRVGPKGRVAWRAGSTGSLRGWRCGPSWMPLGGRCTSGGVPQGIRRESRASKGGPEEWADLHQEIARLPGRYRDPIVLCYFEGLTSEAAAGRLGCPQNTILSRLARARERLRRRLTPRGLMLPAVLPSGALSPGPGVALFRQGSLRSRCGRPWRSREGTRATPRLSRVRWPHSRREGLNAMMISKLKYSPPWL